MCIPQAWPEPDPKKGSQPPTFFLVSGTSTNDTGGPERANVACRSEAEHHLKPYGTHPTIRSLTVDGRQACVVLPSADQPQTQRGQAVLAVTLPAAFDHPYGILVVYAHENEILKIASTIRIAKAP